VISLLSFFYNSVRGSLSIYSNVVMDGSVYIVLGNFVVSCISNCHSLFLHVCACVSIIKFNIGFLQVVAHTIRSSLDKLPGFPRTQIGFITFDSTIHFYNMKACHFCYFNCFLLHQKKKKKDMLKILWILSMQSSLTHPQMMVISDLDDVFVPFPDDLIVNLSESRSTVESFLDGLSSMFQGNMNEESAFGPALKAAFMVMVCFFFNP
jgi:protein transport protein SEC24